MTCRKIALVSNTHPVHISEGVEMSTKKHPVSVLFTDEEYAKLVRRAAELTLEEGRRVSVAELVRRGSLANFEATQEASSA